MDAILPPSGQTKEGQITGVSCPDCPGVLGVRRAEHHLMFRCRIGHAYTLRDLIEVKEQLLERALWSSVTALDELATLLRDVTTLRETISATNETLEKRIARASAHADAIRRIIEENDPVVFDDAAEESG